MSLPATATPSTTGTRRQCWQFSISHLRLPMVIVCGHYSCGGIRTLEEDAGDGRHIPIWLINAQKA